MAQRMNPAWSARAAATALLALLVLTAPATGAMTLARAKQETFFTITPGRIEIVYVTTFNMPAAFVKHMQMDADADGRVSLDEQRRYFADLARNVSSGLDLSINGRAVTLVPTGPAELDALEGGRFIEEIYRFTVPHPPGWKRGVVVEFHNDNYLDFGGEILVEVDPGDGADIVYDSRWEQPDQDPGPGGISERDVVFRYRRGTGKWQRPAGFRAGLRRAGPRTVRKDLGSKLTPLWLTIIGVLTVLLCAIWVVAGRLGGAGWKPIIASTGAILAGGAIVAALVIAGDTIGDRSADRPSDLQAAQIFQNLHRNIYRAFDAKTESDIYDTLAAGLSGQILDEVYNEVYQSFVSRNRGGGRFSVRRIKPIATTVLPAEDGDGTAYRVRYRWRVYGAVTHAGHTHARANEYEAVYLVRHTGGVWRIAGSQVRQNKRVTVGQS